MKVKNIYKNFATKFFSYSLLSLWAVSAFATENKISFLEFIYAFAESVIIPA